LAQSLISIHFQWPEFVAWVRFPSKTDETLGILDPDVNPEKAAAMMDVDGCRPEEASGAYCVTDAGTPLPLPGCKRTRSYCSFGTDCRAPSLPMLGLKRKHACYRSATDGGSTPSTEESRPGVGAAAPLVPHLPWPVRRAPGAAAASASSS
jgi:hypothetical protein